MTLSFLNAILRKGAQKPLQLEDLDPLPNSDRPQTLPPLSQDELRNLLRSLFKRFMKRWAIGVFAHLASLSMIAATPFVIRSLVEFYAGKGQVWDGVIYAIVLVVLNQAHSLAIIHRLYQSYRIGNNCRTILMNAIYSKSLKLSNYAKQQSTTGETGKYLLSFLHLCNDILM